MKTLTASWAKWPSRLLRSAEYLTVGAIIAFALLTCHIRMQPTAERPVQIVDRRVGRTITGDPVYRMQIQYREFTDGSGASVTRWVDVDERNWILLEDCSMGCIGDHTGLRPCPY